MAYLVLDLETIPDPELPRPSRARTGPTPFRPHRAIRSWRLDARGSMTTRANRSRSRRLSREGDERVMLAKLGAILQRAPTVVTWNGRHFDMPV